MNPRAAAVRGDSWKGKTMEKKYIETAREVLSSYGSGQGVDLQHLLAVLIGRKAGMW